MFGVGEPLANFVSKLLFFSSVALNRASHLVDGLVPLLAAYSDFNSLFHKTSRDDNASKLSCDAASGLGHWRRHDADSSSLGLITASSVQQAHNVGNSPIERRLGNDVQMFNPELAKADLKKVTTNQIWHWCCLLIM